MEENILKEYGMEKITILKPEDVRKCIADAFHVKHEKVHIRRFMETKGYGMGEHDEPTFQIEIEEET